MTRMLVAAILGVLAAACGIAPTADPVAVYDFGLEPPAHVSAQLNGNLALHDVGAPSWLQSSAIVYRLAYRDPTRAQPYARARWAAAPAALVGQRLRQAIGQHAKQGVSMVSDGLHSGLILRVELDSFTQVIESPTAARGVVRMRASLIDTGSRSLRAQRMFVAEHPSPSVDAVGAVRALSAATDAVIAQLVEWTAAEMAKPL